MVEVDVEKDIQATVMVSDILTLLYMVGSGSKEDVVP